MAPKRLILCLHALLSMLLVFVIFTNDVAAQMVAGLPKRFHLTGIIELIYEYADSETDTARRKSSSANHSITQRYGLGVEGYIYHPRLAVFSSDITYTDTRTKNNIDIGSRNINYSLFLTFLPYRPVSLTVYAQKIDYRLEGLTSHPVDATANLYGASFVANLRHLPEMRLFYDHRDTNFFGYVESTKKLVEDRFTFTARGSLNRIKTRYGLTIAHSDVSSPSLTYKGDYIGVYTSTPLKKDAIFSTSFASSKRQFSDLTTFNASLDFRPLERFNHNYKYLYVRSKYFFKGSEVAGTVDQSTVTYTGQLSGSWSYRLTKRLNIALSLTQMMNEKDDTQWDSYGASPSVMYRRSIAGFDAFASYRFYKKEDQISGRLNEHDVDLRLTTRKLRWATIYTNYALHIVSEDLKIPVRTEDFSFETEQEFIRVKVDSTVHSFTIGVRGRALPRAPRSYWNIEGEYLQSTSTRERPTRFSEFSTFASGFFQESEESTETEILTRKLREYALTGDLFYPLGRGSVSLKAGYVKSKTDSNIINRYYYEERFAYPILRKLLFSLWWREMWDKSPGVFERKTRNYQVLLNYRVGKTSLEVRYDFQEIREKSAKTSFTRLALMLRRLFG